MQQMTQEQIAETNTANAAARALAVQQNNTVYVCAKCGKERGWAEVDYCEHCKLYYCFTYCIQEADDHCHHQDIITRKKALELSRETLEKAEQERIAVAEDEAQKGIMLKEIQEVAEDEYLDYEKE